MQRPYTLKCRAYDVLYRFYEAIMGGDQQQQMKFVKELSTLDYIICLMCKILILKPQLRNQRIFCKFLTNTCQKLICWPWLARPLLMLLVFRMWRWHPMV